MNMELKALTDHDLIIVHELINNSQVQGNKLELVLSLKHKISNEANARGITGVSPDGTIIKKPLNKKTVKKKAKKRK